MPTEIKKTIRIIAFSVVVILISSLLFSKQINAQCISGLTSITSMGNSQTINDIGISISSPTNAQSTRATYGSISGYYIGDVSSNPTGRHFTIGWTLKTLNNLPHILAHLQAHNLDTEANLQKSQNFAYTQLSFISLPTFAPDEKMAHISIIAHNTHRHILSLLPCR